MRILEVALVRVEVEAAAGVVGVPTHHRPRLLAGGLILEVQKLLVGEDVPWCGLVEALGRREELPQRCDRARCVHAVARQVRESRALVQTAKPLGHARAVACADRLLHGFELLLDERHEAHEHRLRPTGLELAAQRQPEHRRRHVLRHLAALDLLDLEDRTRAVVQHGGQGVTELMRTAGAEAGDTERWHHDGGRPHAELHHQCGDTAEHDAIRRDHGTRGLDVGEQRAIADEAVRDVWRSSNGDKPHPTLLGALTHPAL